MEMWRTIIVISAIEACIGFNEITENPLIALNVTVDQFDAGLNIASGGFTSLPRGNVSVSTDVKTKRDNPSTAIGLSLTDETYATTLSSVLTTTLTTSTTTTSTTSTTPLIKEESVRDQSKTPSKSNAGNARHQYRWSTIPAIGGVGAELAGHSIASFTDVFLESLCAKLCIKDNRCFSFNYFEEEAKCVINDKSEEVRRSAS